MSALSIQPTYPIFTDIDGQPLEDGYIWIGVANLAPIVNPITVYWDAALTIPAVQPVRTRGGYPINSGTPARLYVNSDYSIQVQNRNGSVVYSAPTATERYNNVVISSMNAADVIYTPNIPGAPTTDVAAALDQTVSATSFGVVGDGVTDDTVAIQNALVWLAQNGGTLVFPYGTYLTTSKLILPFGNNATDKWFTVDFGNSKIRSNVNTPTGATFTGFVSGFLSGSTPVEDITGTEAHVAANTVIKNLNINGFGTGMRLNNFNYGCALQNIQTENCFNGINLTRCFYLQIDNMPIRGMGRNVLGGVGFRTVAFSNIMPMTGIKVGQCDTGMQIGGFDGGKMTDCSAEGCHVGVELVSESSAVHLDTFYLEGNDVADLKLSSVVRRGLITNSWLYADPDKHIISTTDGNGYNNIVFINTVFAGGVTNSPPIQNLYGALISCDGNPVNNTNFSGMPNMERLTSVYEVDTSGFGYNGTVRSMDSRGPNGIIPTAYGGRYRNGVTSGNNAPYQTVVDNAGSLEFTTQFNNDGFTALLWSVRIDHFSNFWSGTFMILFDNDNGAQVWRCFRVASTGWVLDTTVSCTVSGGFLKLKAPTFTGPAVNYSVVRAL